MNDGLVLIERRSLNAGMFCTVIDGDSISFGRGEAIPAQAVEVEPVAAVVEDAAPVAIASKRRAAKSQESPADMLYRLYRKGLEEGVTILTDGDTEKKYATSGTMPSIIYAVSETGCSCQGYKSFARCKHYAMLLEHVGKRPPTEAEIEAARAEYDREMSLFNRNKIKSTADWRYFHNVKRTYERVMSFGAAAAAQPTTLAAD